MERRSQRTALQVEDFNFLDVLGQGGFGKVFLAEYRPRRTLLAVKMLRKSAITNIGSLETEKRVLEGNTRRKHPCLISLFGCFRTPTHVALAVEYAPGGDLWHYCAYRELLQEPCVRFCGGCVTLGLEYLHSAKIIYRDLKLENLVIDPEGYIKITDFGLCKEGMGYGDRAITYCGTPETLAPEVVEHKPYSRAVDWWSFGSSTSCPLERTRLLGRAQDSWPPTSSEPRSNIQQVCRRNPSRSCPRIRARRHSI